MDATDATEGCLHVVGRSFLGEVDRNRMLSGSDLEDRRLLGKETLVANQGIDLQCRGHDDKTERIALLLSQANDA